MDLEIKAICDIQNELDIDFIWFKYSHGISLKLDALEKILEAIRKKGETE